jgi:hypothetical protein
MEQRAFARAGRTAQRHKIAARHRQIHAAQDFERAFADGVSFFESARGQDRFTHGKPPIEKKETSNIQHPTSKAVRAGSSMNVRRWMLVVRFF